MINGPSRSRQLMLRCTDNEETFQALRLTGQLHNDRRVATSPSSPDALGATRRLGVVITLKCPRSSLQRNACRLSSLANSMFRATYKSILQYRQQEMAASQVAGAKIHTKMLPEKEWKVKHRKTDPSREEGWLRCFAPEHVLKGHRKILLEGRRRSIWGLRGHRPQKR